MILRILPIKYGDCIIIEWKDEIESTHIGILDGGSISSYKEYLRELLMSLSIPIDFWIISHAHSDHIGGAIKYFNDIMNGYPLPVCKCWITNFVVQDVILDNLSSDGTIATSVSQGNRFISYLSQQKDIPIINELHTGMQIDFHGLNITIVTAPRINEYFEIEEDTIATRPCFSDFKSTIDDFDLKKFEEDSNLTNASSLSVIVESEGKRFLWLADSLPSVYIPALKYLKNEMNDSLKFDIVSFAHHGSNGNTNMEYLGMIQSNKFLVTANAENTQNLPNKETICRVIMNPKRDIGEHLQFLFPMENNTLRSMFCVDGNDIMNKLNFSCTYGCTELEI